MAKFVELVADIAAQATLAQIDRMPVEAMDDWVRRYGQPRNRDQFIVRIALHSIRFFHLPGRQALRFAGQSYRDFERDSRTRFGDPAFAWDDDAARILAFEYGSDR